MMVKRDNANGNGKEENGKKERETGMSMTRIERRINAIIGRRKRNIK